MLDRDIVFIAPTAGVISRAEKQVKFLIAKKDKLHTTSLKHVVTSSGSDKNAYHSCIPIV